MINIPSFENLQIRLTLKVVNDKENRQTLLYGIGDQHLDVAVSKLLSKYKVDVEVLKPRVPYRDYT